MSRDDGELHWIEYEGLIAAESAKAFGIRTARAKEIEAWLPKSQVKRIAYVNGGDSVAIQKGLAITAIEMPWWLAQKLGMVGRKKD